MSYNALYIHIPFCLQVCDYCAFYIIDRANSTVRRRYLKRLNEELQLKRQLCGSLQTIYLGGGTPTFFSVAELETLMALLNKHFTLSTDCEFSIECNPDSLTEEKVKVLQDGGVNRFSLGVQSFSKETRSIIGRAGEISRIHRAIEILNAFDVRNFNCDLIYGIPGQTLYHWEDDLKKIAQFHPPHISTYALAVEKGTPLARRGFHEGEENTVIQMWKLANNILKDTCGLRRYEVSNLAKAGFECRHNYNIWMGATFLGAGPSACYFDGKSRWTNPVSLEKWNRGESPLEDCPEPSIRAVEILITGLRTISGWNRNYFVEVTGFDFFDLRCSKLNEFIKSGYMSYNNKTLQLTEKGLFLADYLGQELL